MFTYAIACRTSTTIIPFNGGYGFHINLIIFARYFSMLYTGTIIDNIIVLLIKIKTKVRYFIKM